MRAIPFLTADTTSCTPPSHADTSGNICFHRDSVIHADTFKTIPSTRHYMPLTPLQINEHLTGDLFFTFSFAIIFSFIRLRGKNIFSRLLPAVIKRKKTETILNEGILPNIIYYLLSLILSFSVISVFVSYTAWGEYLNIYNLYIFIGLLSYHFSHLLLLRLLGWTFDSKALADEITANVWIFNITCGLLVSPFVIASFYVHKYAAEQLVYITVLALTLLFIIKIVRWIEILLSYRISILYTILYLCVSEIMPPLVIYKLVAQ